MTPTIIVRSLVVLHIGHRRGGCDEGPAFLPKSWIGTPHTDRITSIRFGNGRVAYINWSHHILIASHLFVIACIIYTM